MVQPSGWRRIIADRKVTVFSNDVIVYYHFGVQRQWGRGGSGVSCDWLLDPILYIWSTFLWVLCICPKSTFSLAASRELVPCYIHMSSSFLEVIVAVDFLIFVFYTETSVLSEVDFVLCLDSISKTDNLFLHVSKPPKEGTPAFELVKVKKLSHCTNNSSNQACNL